MKKPKTFTRKTITWVLLSLLPACVWFFTLRPVGLGGPAGYVMVRGVSMLPTYETGDLIITRKAASYRKGEIVAYHVPKGQFGAGIVVIHRIIGGSADKGFVIQGDNNSFRDDWNPKPKDIVGHAWVRLPRVGLVLAFLHAPLPMASFAVGVVLVFVLFPEDDKKKNKAKTMDLLAAALAEPDSRPAIASGEATSPAAIPVGTRFRRPSVMAVLPCVVHVRTTRKVVVGKLEARRSSAENELPTLDDAA